MPHIKSDAQAVLTADVAMVVTTADGRTYNLGRPSSVFYPLRLRLYKFKRRAEFRAAQA